MPQLKLLLVNVYKLVKPINCTLQNHCKMHLDLIIDIEECVTPQLKLSWVKLVCDVSKYVSIACVTVCPIMLLVTLSLIIVSDGSKIRQRKVW